MSPAAVEARSPMANRQNPSSSEPLETSSGFGLGGLHGRGGFAGGSDSRPPERARPRMVKVRRQVGFQGPRTRREAFGSGFNPVGSSTGFGPGNVGGGNGGFVFGADRSSLGEGSVNVGNLGFVFGAKENNPESNICVEKERFVAEEAVFNSKTESQSVPVKFDAGSESNLNRKKAQGSEFAEKSSCNEGEKKKLGNEAERFVFGATQSSLNSESSRNSASVKTGCETEVKKSTCSEFKFGASCFNSESNLNSKNKDSNENIGTRSQNVEGADKFDTRNSNLDYNARGSDSNEPAKAKFQDEVKLNRGKSGNSDNNLGPGLGFSFNNIHENGDCSASVSGTNSAFKLPDEMRKLNINESVNVSVAEKTYIFGTNLSSNDAGISSVNRRYRKGSRGLPKVSKCYSRSTETNSGDKSPKGHSFDTERINVNIFGISSRNGVSGTSGTEPFNFRAGFSESGHANQINKGRGIDNKEPTVASSKDQESQPSVSEPAVFGKEKDTGNSPITPDKLGESSTDFGTPLCDPSSLKESLFPELDKKLQFSIKNGSIKDKRLRETRRKSKKPPVKQCHGQDDHPKERSVQEDPKTPGCYSPMDFSPYQESNVTDQCPKETSVESAAELRSEMSKEKSQTELHNSSSLDDQTKCFMFSTASAEQGKLFVRKRRFRRKSRMGVSHDSFVINPSTDFKPDTSSMQYSPHSQSEGQGSVSEVHETCENWRLRGNQAYKSGDLSKAEMFYTQGIVSVPSNERSGSCLEPLLLCYSNRAAARMQLQRVREAIGDCITASALDHSFIKAHLRAANCHLLLGEIEHALQYFTKCMEIGAGVCLDRRIILDAANGQQKAQKVAEYINQSAKLLEEKSPDAARSALEIISEALSICPYSEKLLKMKAEALIVLRRHDEAIQLCEQSLSFAEKNFNSVNALEDIDGSASERYSFLRLWRWFLISKSYFHMGKLEAALPLLDKLKQRGSINEESLLKDIESSTSLAATICNLLQHKNAGNEAFKSGQYSEAVDHYTLALSSNIESRRFAAVCFCNRAAAHQALSQIADAIADCSLAIALDGNYAKAVSRRAVLHEMIRDYGQAASDLQRLIAILNSQQSDKAKESGTSGRSAGYVKELRQAQKHLPVMEEEAKNGVSLNFYLILGSKQSDTSADIKKAYRKAALKHHPDKAGQFLARSERGDEGRLWKEISQEVHKDADRLFKMIGEAYAVLSDPSKRSQHDLDEELRKASKANGVSSPAQRRNSDAHTSTSRSGSYGQPDFQSSPFGKSSYRRNFRDNWKTYGNSYSRW